MLNFDCCRRTAGAGPALLFSCPPKTRFFFSRVSFTRLERTFSKTLHCKCYPTNLSVVSSLLLKSISTLLRRLLPPCGAAATYYTCAESLLDYWEVDQLSAVQQAGVAEVINPLLAGASTGLLYKSMGESRGRCRFCCMLCLVFIGNTCLLG